MTDPISDFLIRIKNAYMGRRQNLEVPHSKMKELIANVLVRHGFLTKVNIEKDGVKKTLILDLNYQNKEPKLTDIEIISKPSKRVYVSYRNLPKVLGGLGITIISTGKGVVSGTFAHKNKLGGEFICKVW